MDALQRGTVCKGSDIDGTDAIGNVCGTETGAAVERIASDRLTTLAELDAFEFGAAGEHAAADQAVFQRWRFDIFQIRAAGEHARGSKLFVVIGQEVDASQTGLIPERRGGDVDDRKRGVLVIQRGEACGDDQMCGRTLDTGDIDRFALSYRALFVLEVRGGTASLMIGIVDAGVAHIIVVANVGRRQSAGVFIQRVTASPLGGQGHVAAYPVTVKVPVHAVFRLPGDKDAAVFYRIIRLPYMAAKGNSLTVHRAAASGLEAHNSGALPDVVDRTIGNGNIRAAAVKGTAEGISRFRSSSCGVLLVPGPAEEGACLPVSCLCQRIFAQVGVISRGQGAAGENLTILDRDAAAGHIVDGQAVLQRTVLRLVDMIGQRCVEMNHQQIGLPQQVLGRPFVAIDLVLKAD